MLKNYSFIVFILNISEQKLKKCVPKPVKMAFLNKKVTYLLIIFVILTTKIDKEFLKP